MSNNRNKEEDEDFEIILAKKQSELKEQQQQPQQNIEQSYFVMDVEPPKPKISLEQALEQIKNLEKDKVKLLAEIQQLNHDLVTSQADSNLYKSNFDQDQTQLLQLFNTIDKVNSQLNQTDIIKQAQVKTNLFEDLPMQIKKLEQTLNSIKNFSTEKQNLKEQNQKLETIIQTQADQRQKLNEECLIMESKQKELLQKIETLNNQGNKSKIDLEKQLADSKENVEKEKKQKDKMFQDYQNNVNRLEQQNKQLQEEKTQIKNQINQLNIQLAQKGEQVSNAIKEINARQENQQSDWKRKHDIILKEKHELESKWKNVQSQQIAKAVKESTQAISYQFIEIAALAQGSQTILKSVIESIDNPIQDFPQEDQNRILKSELEEFLLKLQKIIKATENY